MIHARTDYDRIQDPDGLIPADEPVLLFRAQDRHAPEVARFYASLVASDGNDVMEEAALAQEARMLAWQEEHGSKSPDMPADAVRSL